MKHVTKAENTWCPGCGNFGMLTSVNNAIDKLASDGVPKEELVMVTGIGCHGKIFDYLGLSGIYSLHGRAIATAEGVKLGNPKLKVIVFVGDGDCMGEGFAHLMFAAKKNIDITVVMHNNMVYALTTGQYTPLSPKGFKSRTSPRGNVEEPFNALRLVLEAGGTFVGRSYCMKMDHMTKMIVDAVKHEGFSFVDVRQVCKTYNDLYDVYNKTVSEFEGPLSYEEAMKLALEKEKLPIGVFYSGERGVFNRDCCSYSTVQSREERIAKIKEMLSKS